jgi:hypothetical protein
MCPAAGRGRFDRVNHFLATLTFALAAARGMQRRAVAQKKAQRPAGLGGSVPLVVSAKSRCVTPLGELASIREASCRRRSFAKATGPAQRNLHFLPHLSPPEFPAIRPRLPSPEGLWRSRFRPQPPHRTSIRLVERGDAAFAPALPRPGTKANPMPHAPDTRREATGECDARPEALAGFQRAVGAPAALARRGGIRPLKRSSGFGERAPLYIIIRIGGGFVSVIGH